MEKIALQQLLQGVCRTASTAPVDLVVTDSRKVQPGCVFVAVKGERTDGHNYVGAALQAGAICAVVDHLVENAPAGRQAVVPNTLHALIAMAGNYRARYSPAMVGITGSVGKTTTKEFTYAALSAFGKTLKNEGNKNNEIGLPETLFNLDGSYQFAIAEMGMNKLGDISLLTHAARPHIALITGIGISHIELLGSQENILKAKLEICEALPQGATLVLCGDDARLLQAPVREDLKKAYFALDNPDAEVCATAIEPTGDGTRFTIQDKRSGNFLAHIPAMGRHNVSDALGAYTLATRLGLPNREVALALANYTPAGMRQKIVQHKGVTCVEDCYNAAPDSMRAALDTLAELPVKGRRIAVLGDMLELGEDTLSLHCEVGRIAAQKGIDCVYTCGTLAREICRGAAQAGVQETGCFDEKDQVAAQLARVVRPGDAVLFKASRAMAFEDIIEAYYNS